MKSYQATRLLLIAICLCVTVSTFTLSSNTYSASTQQPQPPQPPSGEPPCWPGTCDNPRHPDYQYCCTIMASNIRKASSELAAAQLRCSAAPSLSPSLSRSKSTAMEMAR